MIHVGMRDKYPTDDAGCRRKQGVDVFSIEWTGIDHGPFIGYAIADQIAVGARAGHHAGVVGGDPNHPFRQTHCMTCLQFTRYVAQTIRIESANFCPCWLIGHYVA